MVQLTEGTKIRASLKRTMSRFGEWGINPSIWHVSHLDKSSHRRTRTKICFPFGVPLTRREKGTDPKKGAVFPLGFPLNDETGTSKTSVTQPFCDHVALRTSSPVRSRHRALGLRASNYVTRGIRLEAGAGFLHLAGDWNLPLCSFGPW